MSIAYLLAAAAAAVNVPDAASVRMMHQYGACVVARDERRSLGLLAMDYRTDAYSQALRKLAGRNTECVPPGGQLRFHSVLFAGALAEGLIKENFKGAELAQLLAVDPANSAVAVRSDLEAMALCALTRAPAAGAGLLATAPMRKEESAAMQGFAPQLTQCLRKDLKVTFNRPALRSVLALTAWRIASTQKALRR